MPSNSDAGRPESRRYMSRGVDVQIGEAESGGVNLRLDGMPVDVIFLDGEYHSQLANMFTGFPTIDDLVDSLLETQGKTWVLRGLARTGACHGGGGHGHGGGHDHGGGGHDHGGDGHDHGGGHGDHNHSGGGGGR
ncbi:MULTISPECIES: hypothetical protein [Streptomyces]|uniref:Uncharacterized protein n=1 Tax=Streptomyces antibioticus TaxID=1890 RepID=A0AAE7CIF0_STRAT|nr:MULTISPECIES: hypothetical protein [Streptomyces]MCX5167362.1 hypothetical protein [Streptomyces antibioticus]QIT42109.1 hypothetical protein HCX60_05335 [Streptomyces antibioticus]GLV95163.1 hypothetical protein Slala04_66160 [Streptomyces lavendulae subsp. lavendulae]